MFGFDAQNKGDLAPRFICRICSFILRDPAQLVCGHRYCHSCIDKQKEATIKCVECQEDTPLNEIMRDRGFENDMSSLPIKCCACVWTGVLKDYQDHLDRCHPNLSCEVYCGLRWCGCDSQIREKTMQEHYLSPLHQRAVANGLAQCISKKDSIKLSTTTTTTSAVETIANQTRQASKLARSIQNVEGQLSRMKKNIEEWNNLLIEVLCKGERLRKNLVLIREKIEQIPKAFFDGMLIWRVTNFRQQLSGKLGLSVKEQNNIFDFSLEVDNPSEQTTAIDSHPFYSAQSGYKMSLRLYPHGNGDGRQKFMSLFFILMEGDYDAILKWPFDFRVTFCLYDQSGEENHIIKSFRCDTKPNSFKRPDSITTTGIGIPEFVPLAMFENEDNAYVRDDTIFIKVMINDYSVPRQLLPQILSIDPAFSPSIRQERIQKMIEEHDCYPSKLVFNLKHSET